MNLKDPFQRELVEHLGDGLASVPLIGQQIVQVEQDAAVGAPGHAGDVGAVGQPPGARAQVVDARLDEEGQLRRRVVGPHVLGGDLNAGGGLRGRQQEAGVDAAISQDLFG